jgi:hypothetical protein
MNQFFLNMITIRNNIAGINIFKNEDTIYRYQKHALPLKWITGTGRTHVPEGG